MPDSPFSSHNNAFEADLRRLRQLPSAAPAPFLYTRVQARLLAVSEGRLPWWLRRPAHLLAVLSLLLALNVGAVLHVAYQRYTTTATTTTPLDSFASEYQLTPYIVAYE